MSHVQNQIDGGQEVVKLINAISETQYAFSSVCDHLGIMICPLLVITRSPYEGYTRVEGHLRLFAVDSQPEVEGVSRALCVVPDSRENIHYSALKSQK